MHRTQVRRPQIAPLHPNMHREDFEMFNQTQSLETPSGSNYIDHRRSQSLNYEDIERPNRVISGLRRFNKAFFTTPRGNIDSHANRIVAKLEEDKALMDDTPVSEQLRKEALRDLPQNLTMKRCVKMKLSKSVSQKSKKRPISFWKRTKYRITINYSKFVGSLKNFNYFELWHSSLKDIEGRFGSGYASYFKFLRWLFIMNFVIAFFPLIFLVVPQVIYDVSGANGTTQNTQTFDFKHVFIGNGYFLETVSYYGHYTNNYIEVIPHFLYNMSAAYFSVFVILYLLQFIILAVSVAQLYRRTFIETEGGFRNVYANRIFCGWDYGIATKEASQLKHSSIYRDLKELLSEEIKDYEVKTFMFKFWTYSIQIVVNVLVLVILGGVGWLNWTLLDKYAGDENSIVVTAISVNLIIMTFPTVFSYISRYEDYQSPRTAIYITLIRTYLLGSVIIGTILTFWLHKSNYTNCWENGLATEIYRLIIFDFLFSVILSILIDLGYFIGRYFLGKDPKSEFNIAKNTLQIIYNQGLFWVGFVYSPILPIIVTIKMFIIWYVREISVRKLCRPPKQTYRAAQAQTTFMTMTFVSVLLIIAAHGYSLNSVQASSTCGPFKNYNYIYEIVTNSVENFEENDFGRVFMNVFKPGGIAIIMMALLILVYYLRKQAYATKEKVKMLRETLVWMAKDKKFLVQWYNELTKGEINPHLRDNRLIDPAKVLPQEYAADNYIGSISEEEFNYRFKKYY